MYNNDFFKPESNIVGDNNFINNDMDVDVNYNSFNNNDGMNIMQQPINEGIQEKVIHRTFVHEVPHVCPVHTRIINHHVFKHTYRPCYTCSEENVCSNVQCGRCPGIK